MAKSLLSLNPPRKTSPENSGCGKPPAQGWQSTQHSFFPCLSLSLLALLSFPALTNSLSRTERKSMPLTVDFGNQRWVLARRKLVWGLQPPVSGTERALPVIGIDKSRLQRGFFSWSFLPDNSFGIWTYFFRLKVFARGPCWSEELTAAAIKKDENVLCVWRFKLSSDEAVFFFLLSRFREKALWWM